MAAPATTMMMAPRSDSLVLILINVLSYFLLHQQSNHSPLMVTLYVTLLTVTKSCFCDRKYFIALCCTISIPLPPSLLSFPALPDFCSLFGIYSNRYDFRLVWTVFTLGLGGIYLAKKNVRPSYVLGDSVNDQTFFAFQID